MKKKIVVILKPSSQSPNVLSDFQGNVASVHLFQHKVTLWAINGIVEEAFYFRVLHFGCDR